MYSTLQVTTVYVSKRAARLVGSLRHTSNSTSISLSEAPGLTQSELQLVTTTHLPISLFIIAPHRRHDNSHIATVASKLRDLNDKVEAIKREQKYQREIEAEFRNSSEITNSRAVWWVVLQMVVLIATAMWQIRYLKVGRRCGSGKPDCRFAHTWHAHRRGSSRRRSLDDQESSDSECVHAIWVYHDKTYMSSSDGTTLIYRRELASSKVVIVRLANPSSSSPKILSTPPLCIPP
jgi:hypothetical protein